MGRLSSPTSDASADRATEHRSSATNVPRIIRHCCGHHAVFAPTSALPADREAERAAADLCPACRDDEPDPPAAGSGVRLRGTDDERAAAKRQVQAALARLGAELERERSRLWRAADADAARGDYAEARAEAGAARRVLSRRTDAAWWSTEAPKLAGVQLLALGRAEIERATRERLDSARAENGVVPVEAFAPQLVGAPEEVRVADRIARAKIEMLADADALAADEREVALANLATRISAGWWLHVGRRLTVRTSLEAARWQALQQQQAQEAA